jgi:hypothetical protein
LVNSCQSISGACQIVDNSPRAYSKIFICTSDITSDYCTSIKRSMYLKYVVICVSRPKSECASFLAEAQPRLETGEDKRHFWQRCTLNFLGDRTNYKAKDITEKITNLFCIYLFQIHKFINTYILTFCFIVSICYQVANKTRNLLFAIQLLIYIIYGDRTIISFVGFVAKLLNRSTDGATVGVRKRVTFRSLVST